MQLLHLLVTFLIDLFHSFYYLCNSGKLQFKFQSDKHCKVKTLQNTFLLNLGSQQYILWYGKNNECSIKWYLTYVFQNVPY